MHQRKCMLSKMKTFSHLTSDKITNHYVRNSNMRHKSDTSLLMIVSYLVKETCPHIGVHVC
jgi:hypothetical protein